MASPELSDEQMMKELQVHLPPVYMPSSCITLSHLPELPNGKVDRKRLEAMAIEALADALNDSINACSSPISTVEWSQGGTTSV